MKTISHTRRFSLGAPVDEVFPLFSPEGEKLWVPGWDYRNLTGTAELAEDDVFLTTSHDHAATEAVWLVKRYEPQAHTVEFYKVEPNEKVGLIRVRCRATDPRRTEIEVTYNYRALSASGEAFVADFTDDVYGAFIGEWQSLLAAHFALGDDRPSVASDSRTGFAVIYRWRLNPGDEDAFRQAWETVTRAFMAGRGARGSRLHRADDGTWVAYAQWPSRQAWERSREQGAFDPAVAAAMAEATAEAFTPILLTPVCDHLLPG